MTDTYAANCFQSDHVAQEDMQQVEDNFTSLNSGFAGSSAPANPVAGKRWFKSSVDQEYVRNGANDQWLTLDFIPGTLMLFAQASAPLGWTKKTTFADTAMLCISSDPDGTALGSGGTANPQAGHTHTGPSHTHTGPSHTHSVSLTIHTTGGSDVTGAGTRYYTAMTGAGGTGDTGASGTGATGANTTPKYQEVIICEKD